MARQELKNGQTYYTIRSAINNNFEELYDNMNSSSGKDGQDGKDGSVWFNGSGAPSSSLAASDGDYYIDNDTGNYYQKQSGSWILLGHLGGSSDSDNTGDTEPINTEGLVKKFKADDIELTELTDASRGDIATRLVYEETQGAIKGAETGVITYVLDNNDLFTWTNITRWITVEGKHFVLGDFTILDSEYSATETKTSTLLGSTDGNNFYTIYNVYGSSGYGYLAYVKDTILVGYYGNEIYTVDINTMQISTSALNTGMSYNDYFTGAYELGNQVLVVGSKTNKITNDLVTFEEITLPNTPYSMHYVADDEVYVVIKATPTGDSSVVNGVFKTDINFSTWELIRERSLGSSTNKLARSHIIQSGEYIYVLINTNYNVSYVLWFNRTDTTQQGELTSDIADITGGSSLSILQWILDNNYIVFMNKDGNDYSIVTINTHTRELWGEALDFDSSGVSSSSLFSWPTNAVMGTDEILYTNSSVIIIYERDIQTVFSGREAYILIGDNPEDIDSWVKIAG